MGYMAIVGGLLALYIAYKYGYIGNKKALVYYSNSF